MPPTEAPAWRLFVALPLPEVAAAAVAEALAPYVSAFPRARWMPSGALHVTLRFLGATRPDAIRAIEASLDRLAAADDGAGETAVDVATGHGAGRARGGDGVAWLTIGRGHDSLSALARRLSGLLSTEPSLAEALARPLPEPHLTVARHADQPLIDALTEKTLGPLEVAWRAERVCLLRSFPSRGAASYESLHEARLVGAT